MSGVDIAGLVSEWRKAMEGVTPGPWAQSTQKGIPGHCYVAQVFADDEGPSLLSVDPTPDEDVASRAAAWIARCSPSGISALLDALLAQAAEVEKLTARLAFALDEGTSWAVKAGLATRQRDEALAALKASEEALATISYHYDNQDMSHVDFRVMAATKARSVLENSPAALADATNNPPSDPGTEQREAGR